MKITRANRCNSGYGIVETLIVIIVISGLIAVAVDRYQRVIWEAKKTALHAELLNLRQSILLFKITKGRYPKDLKELITAEFIMPYKDGVIRGKYLEPYSMDKDMNILDPFDMPYAYDPSNGKVWSQKRGFEGW